MPKRQSVPGIGLSLVLDLDYANGYPHKNQPQPLFDGVLLKVKVFFPILNTHRVSRCKIVEILAQVVKQFNPADEPDILLKPSTYSKILLETRKVAMIERVRLTHNGSQLCTDEKEAANMLQVRLLSARYISLIPV